MGSTPRSSVLPTSIRPHRKYRRPSKWTHRMIPTSSFPTKYPALPTGSITLITYIYFGCNDCKLKVKLILQLFPFQQACISWACVYAWCPFLWSFGATAVGKSWKGVGCFIKTQLETFPPDLPWLVPEMSESSLNRIHAKGWNAGQVQKLIGEMKIRWKSDWFKFWDGSKLNFLKAAFNRLLLALW